MAHTLDPSELGAQSPAFPHTADWIGFAGGLVPFALAYRQVRSFSGGDVTLDWYALVGGMVALAAAVTTVFVARRVPADHRLHRSVATALLFLLGAVQLARGLGVF